MNISLSIILLFAGLSGDRLLSDVSDRYSSAKGIQWHIRSVVNSEIFDEADTTDIKFSYSPPDTFSLVGENEKICGIGDTLWVLSARHRQLQKKMVEGNSMPAAFILNWRDDYDLDSFKTVGSNTIFNLKGKESVKPKDLIIIVGGKKRINSISYPDTKGDRVTLTIRREKLDRPGKHDLFFLNIPEGYEFIDLTQ